MFLYSEPSFVFVLWGGCLHKAGNSGLAGRPLCVFCTGGLEFSTGAWWLNLQFDPRLHLPWMKKEHAGICFFAGGLLISISLELPYEIEIWSVLDCFLPLVLCVVVAAELGD